MKHLEKFFMTLRDIVTFGPVRRWEQRFRKRDTGIPLPVKYPTTVCVELQPGATRIQFMQSGHVRADLVLTSMTWYMDREPEPEFRDFTAFMRERTLYRSYPR